MERAVPQSPNLGRWENGPQELERIQSWEETTLARCSHLSWAISSVVQGSWGRLLWEVSPSSTLWDEIQTSGQENDQMRRWQSPKVFYQIVPSGAGLIAKATVQRKTNPSAKTSFVVREKQVLKVLARRGLLWPSIFPLQTAGEQIAPIP